MEDPFVFLDHYCHYSSSQEELFKNSLLAREEISPESSPPPSPSTTAFAGNGIIICSAPDTPPSEAVVSPSGDEFKTPPEESRRSSSDEAPPPPKTLSPPQMSNPSLGGEFDVLKLGGGQGISAVETGSGSLDGGTMDLGLSQEENRTPQMVEMLSDGKVRIREVSKLDLELFRVGEKRARPVQSPSPSRSKRIRVSVDSSLLANTPDLECRTEIRVDSGNGETDQMIGTDVIDSCENGKEELANNGRSSTAEQKHDQMIDTDVIESREDGKQDSAINGGISTAEQEHDQMIDTDVIESCEDAKEDCATNGGISTAEQEHEEEKEERIENGNGGMETVADGAVDQGKRRLPETLTCQNGGKREAEDCSSEGGSAGNGMGVVLEVLRWLAREQREKRHDQGGHVDFLETAKRCGVKFPEPKWWHHQ